MWKAVEPKARWSFQLSHQLNEYAWREVNQSRTPLEYGFLSTTGLKHSALESGDDAKPLIALRAHYACGGASVM